MTSVFFDGDILNLPSNFEFAPILFVFFSTANRFLYASKHIPKKNNFLHAKFNFLCA